MKLKYVLISLVTVLVPQTSLFADVNPWDYNMDYGCWATIEIYEGKGTDLYSQFAIPNPSKLISIDWTIRHPDNLYVEITSQDGGYCEVKGITAGHEAKVWCCMKYGSSSYRAYYLVKVKTTPPAPPEMKIAIDATNFPDINFRNYLLSLPSGTDGVLSEVEIGRIKEIDVRERNISSLKGIELFTGLETLSCSNNQLTSLDVSKNTNLKDLFCQYNNLTSLIIGDNEKLEYVWCRKNDLTSLDLSKCVKLKGLDCSNNKLTSLRIAKNTCSKYLECYNNQIKGEVMDELIDHLYDNSNGSKIELYLLTINDGNVCTKVQVDRIKAKGWIPVRETSYRGSYHWVELFVDDFINPMNFPDDEFRRCLLSKGIFSEEDVKKTKKLWVNNENITSIKGIEYFTALEELDCSYNQLTSINVSKNTALTYIDCSNNQLTSLDLSGNSSLKTLDVKHNQIKGKPMNALIASLPIRPDNDGKFYAYSYYTLNRDGNWITNTQVTASEIRGWKVYIDSTPYGSIYFKAETGDVDDDGVIDEDDIKIVVQCIMGKQEDDVDLKKADVNGDKKVNAADIVEIVKIIKASK